MLKVRNLNQMLPGNPESDLVLLDFVLLSTLDSLANKFQSQHLSPPLPNLKNQLLNTTFED